MSKLDSLKKAKRRLKGVHFEFDGSHVAYTSQSQGGAASLLNEPYLLKSLKPSKPLTQEEKEILLEMGITESELSKSIESSDKDSGLSSPDSGDSAGEEPENLNKGNTKTMSDIELQKQLDEVKRELAVQKAVNTVSKYKLEASVAEGLAGSLASLSASDQVSVLKAMDVLVAAKDAAVEKSVELEKAAAKAPSEENPVTKALSQEAGHSEEGTIVEKSAQQKQEEALAARFQVKK